MICSPAPNLVCPQTKNGCGTSLYFFFYIIFFLYFKHITYIQTTLIYIQAQTKWLSMRKLNPKRVSASLSFVITVSLVLSSGILDCLYFTWIPYSKRISPGTLKLRFLSSEFRICKLENPGWRVSSVSICMVLWLTGFGYPGTPPALKLWTTRLVLVKTQSIWLLTYISYFVPKIYDVNCLTLDIVKARLAQYAGPHFTL